MYTHKVERSDHSATASKLRKAPPARMRNCHIVAQPRTDPDLHKLAQLFIGMTFASADAERQEQRGSAASRRQEPPQDVGN